MNSSVADALRPPAERGSGRALLLALLMHALLLVLIAFGVHWHSHTPQAVQAELWAPTAHLSAPPPPPPVPVHAAPHAVPHPVPQPTQPPAPAPRATPSPQPDQAQIALREQRKHEQQLRAQQEAAQRLQEQRRQEQRQQELQAQRLAARQAALEKAAQARAARRAAEQKAAAEKAAEQKAAAEKAAAEKAARLAAERRREQQLAQLQRQSRQDYLRSLMAQAGSGASAGGSAAATSGPSGGYSARISTLIRQNVIFPQVDQVDGNPKVHLLVTLDPNSGKVLGVRIERSSGVASWDQAVVRAIERLGKLPSDHGRWWTPMEVVAGPRDQAP